MQKPLSTPAWARSRTPDAQPAALTSKRLRLAVAELIRLDNEIAALKSIPLNASQKALLRSLRGCRGSVRVRLAERLLQQRLQSAQVDDRVSRVRAD